MILTVLKFNGVSFSGRTAESDSADGSSILSTPAIEANIHIVNDNIHLMNVPSRG